MPQNILSYTSKDYNSIKEDLEGAIPSLTNIWTNREQSDPGMVLLTENAALGDNLFYNMDKQSLEFYPSTVTQRKNAAKVFELVDYKMHWYESARLELKISNDSSDDITLLFNPSSLSNTQRVTSSIVGNAPPYFMLYPNETASNWNTNKVITIPSKSYKVINAVQGSLSSISFSASSIDQNNRYYLPVTKIDQNNLWLDDSSGYQWYLIEDINKMTEAMPRFQFGVDEYNLPYIEFVPYWRTFGESHTFTLYYLTTMGSLGNVTADILNNISSSTIDNTEIVISHGSNTSVNENLNNVPGKDPQTAKEAYYDSKTYIGTFNTLVTLPDFEKFLLRTNFFSAVRAVDGQYAKEYNETVEDYNKLYSVSPTEINETISIAVDEGDNPSGTIIKDIVLSDLVSSISDYDVVVGWQYKNNDTNYSRALLKKTDSITENYFVISSTDNKKLTISLTSLEGSGSLINMFATVKYTTHDKFAPYTLDLHMVADDFVVKSPTTGTIYADETPKIVDVENQRGYIEYQLRNNITDDSPESPITQSKVNDYKLFTADLNYGLVRKFPFYVDGKIHLREPVRPSEANLILRKVYANLATYFNAYNLTMGKKIQFRDIINVVMSSDSNIEYFDAGANNENGALVVYPTTNNYNPNIVNQNTNPDEVVWFERYGVNIDPRYFNDISLQHYEDIMQDNSSTIYWGDTASGHLSIDAESVSEKTTPNSLAIYSDTVISDIEDTTCRLTAIVSPFAVNLYEIIPIQCVVVNTNNLPAYAGQDYYSVTYALLGSAPDDWSSSWGTYFYQSDDGTYKLLKQWEENKYYTEDGGTYTAVTTEPSDEIDYNDYYIKINDNYYEAKTFNSSLDYDISLKIMSSKSGQGNLIATYDDITWSNNESGISNFNKSNTSIVFTPTSSINMDVQNDEVQGYIAFKSTSIDDYGDITIATYSTHGSSPNDTKYVRFGTSTSQINYIENSDVYCVAVRAKETPTSYASDIVVSSYTRLPQQ